MYCVIVDEHSYILRDATIKKTDQSDPTSIEITDIILFSIIGGVSGVAHLSYKEESAITTWLLSGGLFRIQTSEFIIDKVEVTETEIVPNYSTGTTISGF